MAVATTAVIRRNVFSNRCLPRLMSVVYICILFCFFAFVDTGSKEKYKNVEYIVIISALLSRTFSVIFAKPIKVGIQRFLMCLYRG